MPTRYYLGPIAAIVTAGLLAPLAGNVADWFRVVEISLSVLISISLVSGGILYTLRAHRRPGTTVLAPPEYWVLVTCLLLLLTAATAEVVHHLQARDARPSATLVICVAVQPLLLWWSLRMEARLAEGTDGE